MWSLANFAARQTWYWLIVWMRKPWMRRIHLWPMQYMSPARAERFYASYVRQNEWARKMGVPLLRLAYLILFSSILIQVVVFCVNWMAEQGYLDSQNR